MVIVVVPTTAKNKKRISIFHLMLKFFMLGNIFLKILIVDNYIKILVIME
jgi:hypothetical protein